MLDAHKTGLRVTFEGMRLIPHRLASKLMPKFWSLMWLGVFALIGGCASSPDTNLAAQLKSKTIAVMPLDNQTNSVAGALYMREEMVALLKAKGYQPMTIEQTDQQLANQFGISLGGQITEADLPKIASALQVDAIMTGTLKNFSAVLLSYNEVAASFTLYQAETWLPVWTYDNVASTPFSPLRNESFSTQLISGLVGSVFDRTLGKPMQGVVAEYYRRLQHTLPSGREYHHQGEQQ